MYSVRIRRNDLSRLNRHPQCFALVEDQSFETTIFDGKNLTKPLSNHQIVSGAEVVLDLSGGTVYIY